MCKGPVVGGKMGDKGLSVTGTQRTREAWCKIRSFPGGSDGKESACSAGDQSSIPGLVRSPGEENSYPLQYSGLENSMDREAWQATVQFSSVAQLCPTLCDSMNCSKPGLPVHHQLRSSLKLTSPTVADGYFTTEHPRKPILPYVNR